MKTELDRNLVDLRIAKLLNQSKLEETKNDATDIDSSVGNVLPRHKNPFYLFTEEKKIMTVTFC